MLIFGLFVNFPTDRRFLPNFGKRLTFPNFLFRPFSVMLRVAYPSVYTSPFSTCLPG